MTDGRSLVVVGGGITGLAAAWQAVQIAGTTVTVLEAEHRLGGRIATSDIAGLTVDEGPDSFLARVPWGLELCQELDLTDELVSPAARNAHVYSRGSLRPLPTSQVFGVPLDLDELASTGIVSPEGLAEARTVIDRASAETNDDTIAAVMRRQVGTEIAERLVDPLIGGVNAGDTERLSLQAVAPQLAAAAGHPDGLVAGLRQARIEHPPDPTAPVFHGLPGGTERLVTTLADRLGGAGATLRTAAPATGLARSGGGGFEITVGGPGRGTVLADRVVLATPAPVTAALLDGLAPDPAEALRTIEHASVALLTLVVRRVDIGRPLDASGFLVPRVEGLELTACSWASSKWDHVGDEEHAVLRPSLGRAGAAAVLEEDDAELVATVVRDLATTMDLRGDPVAARVGRHPQSMPQYAPGHPELVDRIDADLADALPGVAVAGWTYRGIGIPASIHSGREAARGLLS